MFLINKNIERVVYVKPPKEVYCQGTTLWKLNSATYRLSDASRSWYLNVKKELIGLGTIVCKSDPAVFVWQIVTNQKQMDIHTCR